MDVLIRQATAADVEPIAEVHVACWQATYRGILPDSLLDGLRVEHRVGLWRDWIAGPGVHTLVAERNGAIVGFTRLCPARSIASPPANAAEISHLYVLPSDHAGGVGRGLLERVLALAQQEDYDSALLWVLEENHRARRFYERMGLTADGARHTDPAYLGNDAVEIRYRIGLGGK